MVQTSLFDPKPKPPVLSPVAQEKKRLSNQCRKILERLQQGPATNAELAKIALKYTGRLSEIRAWGAKITIKERDYETGVVWYQLEI